jgi:O-methyltransferase
MTSPERIDSVCQATRYVHEQGIEGAIVECGVWRGGSMMAVALPLLEAGERERELYLYDTFAGMTEPGELDTDRRGRSARSMIRGLAPAGEGSEWCKASLEDVETNLRSTGYPPGRVRYVPGLVEETIPATVPERIAFLRLDTDWYESTRHELDHLIPRMVPGGVLILDDYGHWQGARRAVDEYLAETGLPLLLNRVDYTARIAVMPGLAADRAPAS